MVSGFRYQILVIEDAPETANLIVLYLENEDLHALQARDGETGLALVREHTPDLALSVL